ncbi:MAG: VCBS repeat-containing protein [Phycisphaeraceae bacterium]|nr:VCBS repeat-containing protein [Phycisphaeraceae bacterium]
MPHRPDARSRPALHPARMHITPMNASRVRTHGLRTALLAGTVGASIALTAHDATARPDDGPQFTLAWSFTFPAPLGPTRPDLVDLDGDGILDAVFPGRNAAGRIYLMKGTGNGSFTNLTEVIVGAPTDWVEAVDMNGDGIVDLVLAVRSSNGRTAVMHGLGGFAFAEPIFTDVGRECRVVTVGEANDSGERPIFSLQYLNSALRALQPTGIGGHAARPQEPIMPWSAGPSFPQWLGRAEVDGAGAPDLLSIATGAGALTMHPGLGGASLGDPRSWRVPLIGSERPGVSLGAIGDFTGNGALDVATAGLNLLSAQALVMFRNDGSGDFADRTWTPVTFEGYAWAVEAGDLDLDGDVDLVMTTALPGGIFVLRNNGSGGFNVAQEISTGSFVRHVRIADLTGDCLPDLLSVDIAFNRVQVYRNITPGAPGCGGVAESASGGLPEEAAAWPVKSGASRVVEEPDARAQANTTALAARVAHARDEGAAAVARVLGDFGIGGASDAPAPPPPSRRLSDGGIADIPPTCGPPNGLCSEPHGAPGCFTTPCCAEVCLFDPSCCTDGWDEICVDYAQQLCVNLFCPSPGSCFEVHSTRGCDDATCCAIISRLDSFCGSASWDELCVTQALLFCTTAPCQLPPPAADSVNEEEPCYQRLNQGCTGNSPFSANWLELTCGAKFDGKSTTGAPRDGDWFLMEVDAPVRVRFHVVAEFPVRVLHVRGVCEGPLELLADTSAMHCAPLVVDACLEPGQHHFVLAPGIPERNFVSGQPCDEQNPDLPPPGPDDPPFNPGFFGLHWQVEVECLACGGVTGDLNGDGLVNGIDLAIVLGNWGACGGCPADLNGDGVVNGADIAILLGNWTG